MYNMTVFFMNKNYFISDPNNWKCILLSIGKGYTVIILWKKMKIRWFAYEKKLLRLYPVKKTSGNFTYD